MQPRLLKAGPAARYLGISETKLRSLSLPRRMLGDSRLYDLRDLDAYADALPYEGDENRHGRNTCDSAFGVSA